MLVNLTPHSVVLRAPGGTDTTIPSSGVCRIAALPKGEPVVVEGCPVPVDSPDVFDAPTGLPDPQAGTWYIVSAVVGSAMAGKGRADLLTLGTGPQDGAIRDEQGRVIAVTRLKAVAA